MAVGEFLQRCQIASLFSAEQDGDIGLVAIARSCCEHWYSGENRSTVSNSGHGFALRRPHEFSHGVTDVGLPHQ